MHHQNNADLIRGGCRGGHDQFNWESLRTMKYHDREQYLGQTTIIGYLDKGGKWRKKDWYAKNDDRNVDDQQLNDEMLRIKEEDERRLRIALGIEPTAEEAKMQASRLTKDEMAQLTKRTKVDFDEVQDTKGLGTETTKFTMSANQNASNILEAYGVQDEYKVKEEEPDQEIKKKIAKKEKKEKKAKKDKKDKKEKSKEKSSKKEKKDKKSKKIKK